MKRIHIVTYVSFVLKKNEVVGAFGDLQTAINAAKKRYFSACKEHGVELGTTSLQTYPIVDENKKTIALVEVNHATLVE